ncbi:MAG: hypothetical protein JO022_05690 [Acidobacteriaceae bacterium]|nr:hypothetical protein [Acidobacteriaceae bacterium]
MRALGLAVILVVQVYAEVAPRLPDWLKAEPGAKDEQVHSGPKSVQQSYEISEPVHTVVDFYRAEIEQAGLRARVDFDGIGTSIRVLAQGASSVITVREGESGTRVKVEYAITDIALPNSLAGRACLEGTRLYQSEWNGRSVCSEAAPLKLVWPSWLDPPESRALEDLRRSITPVGWYDDPSIIRAFECRKTPDEVFDHYRRVFRDWGFTSWGQLQTAEPWVRGMQRPVKNVALDPRHILPEYANVAYVRQVYVQLLRLQTGTQVTVVLQVHNPRM